MSFAVESKWKTQEEKLDIPAKKKDWYIGLPLGGNGENRVGLIPSAVNMLSARGFRIILESGAGEKAGYSDRDFSESGSDIAYSKDEVYKADIILQCSPPTIEDINKMYPGQMLISPLHVGSVKYELIEEMKKKRIVGLAMEYMKDPNGTFPIVRILSELAGTSAILKAGQLLSNEEYGSGILLGGISGVSPAKVVILGAGIVAEYAVRSALGLGVSIQIFDNNISKLMRLQNILGQRLYTSTLDPKILGEELEKADVVIGAIHSDNGRTPMVVTEDIIMKMKKGSVIVDVSIDQGGCFETSETRNHRDPFFIKHGVIHYCVPNISAQYPKSASKAISNIFCSIFTEGGNSQSLEQFILRSKGLAHGIYTYKGSLTNEYISSKFGIKYTALELILSEDL